jgi:hypothetical protein
LNYSIVSSVCVCFDIPTTICFPISLLLATNKLVERVFLDDLMGSLVDDLVDGCVDGCVDDLVSSFVGSFIFPTLLIFLKLFVFF